MRVYVVWATVVRTDLDPPTPEVSGLITDSRVIQFWDPHRVLTAMVRSDADSGRADFAEFKTGQLTPYDIVMVFKPGAHWVEKIPTPAYLGKPVATSIQALKEKLIALGLSAH